MCCVSECDRELSIIKRPMVRVGRQRLDKKILYRMLRGSLVRTATRYGLDGMGMESRWGRNIPQPFQTDPGAHTFSCTMGTASLSRGSNGRGVSLTTHPI